MPEQNKKIAHRVPFYRRPITIILGILIIVIVAVTACMVVKAFSSPDQPEDQPTEETESALVYDTDKAEEEEDDGLLPEDRKDIVQYEGENPNKLDYLTGLITYTEVKDGVLVAMVSIDQYLGDGTCVANLKSNGNIVASSTQPIEADASTSHCAAQIDLTGVSGGKYQLEVVISSGERSGTLTTEVEF